MIKHDKKEKIKENQRGLNRRKNNDRESGDTDDRNNRTVTIPLWWLKPQ